MIVAHSMYTINNSLFVNFKIKHYDKNIEYKDVIRTIILNNTQMQISINDDTLNMHLDTLEQIINYIIENMGIYSHIVVVYPDIKFNPRFYSYQIYFNITNKKFGLELI